MAGAAQRRRDTAEVLFEWMAARRRDLPGEQRQLLTTCSPTRAARVGTMGWCLGGRLALLLAGTKNRLANVVAYHPTVPATPAPNHTLEPSPPPPRSRRRC